MPNPANPAQVASLGAPAVQPAQPAAPAATNAAQALNVPNPGNPAQQGIGQPAATQAPAPAATQAPAPVTVDPRDATYYDQLARLNAAYQGVLLGYQRTTAQDLAGYNSVYGQLTTQLPLTQQATRNQANSQGLLESGILGQRADLNNAAYLTRVGAARARLTAGDQAAMDRLTATENAYGPTAAGYLAAATARAKAADLAAGPTTPAPPGPGRAAKGGGRGLPPVGRPVRQTGAGINIQTPGPVAHDTLGLNGTPTGRALVQTANIGIQSLGRAGSIRRQAARKAVKRG